ncbi:sensor histidine kinase [Nocardioides sp. dk4132]|uniref:sensor histidine kinase n=1 Tax=unclassified Nocardioides TaxID=2615069 RepID=UPI0012953ED1|nr:MULTISPECIES: histidine kinase [unclassified Nocardioides]MQW78050.1 sensor histidine kinase [Nocardioides sp. dk4132]QGA08153.1 sensor histidine kinase [Nocardioides sp. dk884]
MSQPSSVAPIDVRVAAGTGAIVLLGLAALVAVTSAAPDAGVVAPVPSTTAWVLGAVTLLLQAAALLWRRTAPRATLLATALGMLLCGVWGLGDAIGLAQPAVLIAAYTLGVERPLSRDTVPTFALAALLTGAGTTVAGLFGGEELAAAVGFGMLQGVSTVGVPLVVAIVVSTRREIRQARASRTEALEREHGALVQAAVARERTAMARELHDIAAHHLSGIAVMTAAIGTQIDSDPAGAKAAVAQVRQQSTAVLRDLRSLVGLLREDDQEGGPDRVRPESLAGIAALVEDVTGAGRDVGLTVLSGGRPLGDGVGPLAQLAAYRMAQEALANAARHAPGARAEVVIDDRDPDAVEVTVHNERPTAAPPPEGRDGFGILGMRERAELTGASLAVGPTTDGGWQVALEIPRDHRLEGSTREHA